MKLWQAILFGIILGIGINGLVTFVTVPFRGTPIQLLPTATMSPIQVYVTGAVVSPGVYRLQPNIRVEDALKAAGGFSSVADPNSINLAARVKDGEKITVLAINSLVEGNPQTATPAINTSAKPQVVNINKASQQELEILPGIGPAKAATIITYRQEHGPFTKIEDLQLVPGIGAATFERLKPFITID